MLIIWKFP